MEDNKFNWYTLETLLEYELSVYAYNNMTLEIAKDMNEWLMSAMTHCLDEGSSANKEYRCLRAKSMKLFDFISIKEKEIVNAQWLSRSNKIR